MVVHAYRAYDEIEGPIKQLLGGEADKSRLQMYRKRKDWFCTFNVTYDHETGDETVVGVDIGSNHLIGATVKTETSRCLVW